MRLHNKLLLYLPGYSALENQQAKPRSTSSRIKTLTLALAREAWGPCWRFAQNRAALRAFLSASKSRYRSVFSHPREQPALSLAFIYIVKFLIIVVSVIYRFPLNVSKRQSIYAEWCVVTF